MPPFLLLIRFDYNENQNRMSFSSILNNETLSPCHIHGSRYNYINTINTLVLKHKELYESRIKSSLKYCICHKCVIIYMCAVNIFITTLNIIEYKYQCSAAANYWNGLMCCKYFSWFAIVISCGENNKFGKQIDFQISPEFLLELFCSQFWKQSLSSYCASH